MAGVLRRAMVYLGLVDDDYDEYEGYEDPQAASAPPPAPARSQAPVEHAYEPAPHAGVRTLPREAAPPPPPEPVVSSPVMPRPAVVRQITPAQSAKVHVVAPARFPDAQEIGDRLKATQPVIVNLQGADRELSRRMIDFCSGATYALGGSMDKVAEQVFLLTPSNVEVSAEEKRRLQERGLYST